MTSQKSSQIIDALGGTAEVARLCEVEMAAVSQWRNNGIPNARLMYLKLARPDVDWAYLLAASEPTPEGLGVDESKHREAVGGTRTVAGASAVVSVETADSVPEVRG
jgi:hypothetical protein